MALLRRVAGGALKGLGQGLQQQWALKQQREGERLRHKYAMALQSNQQQFTAEQNELNRQNQRDIQASVQEHQVGMQDDAQEFTAGESALTRTFRGEEAILQRIHQATLHTQSISAANTRHANEMALRQAALDLQDTYQQGVLTQGAERNRIMAAANEARAGLIAAQTQVIDNQLEQADERFSRWKRMDQVTYDRALKELAIMEVEHEILQAKTEAAKAADPEWDSKLKSDRELQSFLINEIGIHKLDELGNPVLDEMGEPVPDEGAIGAIANYYRKTGRLGDAKFPWQESVSLQDVLDTQKELGLDMERTIQELKRRRFHIGPEKHERILREWPHFKAHRDWERSTLGPQPYESRESLIPSLIPNATGPQQSAVPTASPLIPDRVKPSPAGRPLTRLERLGKSLARAPMNEETRSLLPPLD